MTNPVEMTCFPDMVYIPSLTGLVGKTGQLSTDIMCLRDLTYKQILDQHFVPNGTNN